MFFNKKGNKRKIKPHHTSLQSDSDSVSFLYAAKIRLNIKALSRTSSTHMSPVGQIPKATSAAAANIEDRTCSGWILKGWFSIIFGPWMLLSTKELSIAGTLLQTSELVNRVQQDLAKTHNHPSEHWAVRRNKQKKMFQITDDEFWLVLVHLKQNCCLFTHLSNRSVQVVPRCSGFALFHLVFSFFSGCQMLLYVQHSSLLELLCRLQRENWNNKGARWFNNERKLGVKLQVPPVLYTCYIQVKVKGIHSQVYWSRSEQISAVKFWKISKQK